MKWVLGNASPKLETSNALVLRPLELSNPNVETLLKLPGFSRTRHLDPRILIDDPTGRVFKTLATSPMAPNLESLTLPGFEPKHARALKLDSPLSLRRLILAPRYLSSFDAGACDSLAASSWLARLEELVVQSSYLITDAFPNGFKALDTLQRLTIRTEWWLDSLLSALTLSPPTKILRLEGQLGGITRATSRTLLGMGLEHAHTLDVSGLMPPEHDDSLTGLIGKVPHTPFGRSFQAVRLGHWYTDALASAFAAQGTSILDAPPRDTP